MPDYSHAELAEALRAIQSIIYKCEKAQEKFPEGNAHYTLLRNRLKAMYISKALITEKLASKPQESTAVSIEDPRQLLSNLEQLHTTPLGAERIRKNLGLHGIDVTLWCKEQAETKSAHITRKGKNWYIFVNNCEITVNAHSYTLITAHKIKL